MNNIFDNDDGLIPQDPIKIPAKYRKKLLAQVMAGEIRPAEFDDVFPRIKKIDISVRWPVKFDYTKLSDSALREIASQLPPDELDK